MKKYILKITADKFNEDYILYQFFDDDASISNIDLDTYKKATFSKTDNESSHGEITSVTKYFTIKKKWKRFGIQRIIIIE